MDERDIDQPSPEGEPPAYEGGELPPEELSEIEELVQRSAAGDVTAWRQLQLAIKDDIEAIVRGHQELRRKGMAHSEDHLSAIRVATFGRLSNKGFANLKSFLKRRQDADPAARPRFDLWLWTAVNYAALAQIRAKHGPAPKTKPKEGERLLLGKADVQSHAGRWEEEPGRDFLRTLGMTARLTGAEIFAWIQREFSAQDVRAMQLYYVEERDYEEIARELELPDAEEANAVIRKLNARLRYHFAKK